MVDRKCRACNCELTDDNTYASPGRICKSCDKARLARQRLELKTLTIKQYGGECACCQESNLVFLTIDHINEDGAAQRRKLFGSKANASSNSFYHWLKKQGYPKGNYQVLCFNCNFAKHVMGVCPHQAKP